MGNDISKKSSSSKNKRNNYFKNVPKIKPEENKCKNTEKINVEEDRYNKMIELKEMGNQYFKQGMYEEAIKSYK